MLSCVPCSVTTGSSMPNHPSAVLILSSAISPALPTASPSPAAKHSILAWFVPLRDRVLAHRQRLIGVLFQLPMQPIQLLAQLCFEGLQILPIHTSTAPVFLHS